MAVSVARPAGVKPIDTATAKKRVIRAISDGMKVAEAMALVGRKAATYTDWYKHDEQFQLAVKQIRAVAADTDEIPRQAVPGFEEFCDKWLNAPLFAHQLRILDVIEGRAPREFHSSMQYEPGDPTRLLFNMPPGHAKTQTFSVHYPVWRILQDPNIKIVIISKSQNMAKRILGSVKHILTSPQYARLQKAFGPEGGFKSAEMAWTQTEFYVAGRGENADGDMELTAKDPTMQALGLNGQLYGARSDLIILDDCVTLTNAAQYENQLNWIIQEVDTRLPPEGGHLMVLGTRVAPTDLYKTIRTEVVDMDDRQVYSYLAQPAVLDYGDDGINSWECLWPAERLPDGTMAPKWTGPRLSRKRTNERMWALVYQQQDILDDATFRQEAVKASINSTRLPGPLTGQGANARPNKMAGLYVVAGLDPAVSGCTAMIVMGIDRQTQKRYILDGYNKDHTSPTTMRETVKRLTVAYGINEWVIEKNAFQAFLSQDPELKQFLYGHGCKLTEHTTGNNKTDPDFGVMGMAPLFDSCGEPDDRHMAGEKRWRRTPEKALIELPRTTQNAWLQELVNQLIVWQPLGMKQGIKTDLVMALWFCDIAAKRVLGLGRKQITHTENRHLSRTQLSRRGVINLAEARAARQAERERGEDDGIRIPSPSWRAVARW